MSKPELYDQRVVRTKAQLVLTYHIAVACPLDRDEHCIILELDCDDDDACKPMQETIDHNVKGTAYEDMRGRFVLVGKFVYLKNAPRESSPFRLRVNRIDVLPKAS